MWTRTSSKLHETRTSPTRFVGLLRAPSPRFLCCVAQPRPSPDLLLHTSHKPCQLIYQTLEWVEALAWLFITSDAKLCHQHGWIDWKKAGNWLSTPTFISFPYGGWINVIGMRKVDGKWSEFHQLIIRIVFHVPWLALELFPFWADKCERGWFRIVSNRPPSPPGAESLKWHFWLESMLEVAGQHPCDLEVWARANGSSEILLGEIALCIATAIAVVGEFLKELSVSAWLPAVKLQWAC